MDLRRWTGARIPVLVKPEYTYENSRFDFYVETKNQKILVEVKGVTLEEDGG